MVQTDGGLTCVHACVHSGFNFTSASRDDVDTFQKIVETFKFGYAERTYLGDEMFANVSEVCLCYFYIFYAFSLILLAAEACCRPVCLSMHTCVRLCKWHLFHFYFISLQMYLQCFDTVGWAAGRASGL